MAAIAVIGMLVDSEDPQIVGAMVIGPLAGWNVFLFYKYVLPKVKAGYEMLVRNFSAGISGMVFGYVSLIFIGPFIAGVTQQIGLFVGWLIQRNLLLFTNVFIESLKVLVLNNTLNHGILAPLGMEQAGDAGMSLLFLIETNPGPGLGVLLAFILFSRKELKAIASGAFMISPMVELTQIDEMPFHLLETIGMVFNYFDPEDEQCQELKEMILKRGLDKIIPEITGIDNQKILGSIKQNVEKYAYKLA